MGLTKLVLKFAAPVPKVEEFERYLFVGPHPDDIEIGAGATAARLAAEGKTVCFVICTDGKQGDGNAAGVKGQKLVELRKEEAIRSAALLGIHDVRFLGFPDGAFYKQKELVCKLAQVVGSFQPDIILAPDPDVINECHQDHISAGRAAKQVACFAPYGGIMERYEAKAAPVKAIACYMTAKPNRYVGIKGYLHKQLGAVFTSHISQFPVDCPESKTIEKYLKLRALEYGLKSFKGQAEGFRVMGVTHMHCLPEAGE